MNTKDYKLVLKKDFEEHKEYQGMLKKKLKNN